MKKNTLLSLADWGLLWLLAMFIGCLFSMLILTPERSLIETDTALLTPIQTLACVLGLAYLLEAMFCYQIQSYTLYLVAFVYHSCMAIVAFLFCSLCGDYQALTTDCHIVTYATAGGTSLFWVYFGRCLAQLIAYLGHKRR